ncbi:phosphoglycerate mutase, partial [mine drainage metagenome]
LCERHVGEADGMSWREYEATYGSMKPGDEPDREMAPGGESWVGFLDRAEAALYEVMSANPGQLAVVAGHGGSLAHRWCVFSAFRTTVPGSGVIRTTPRSPSGRGPGCAGGWCATTTAATSTPRPGQKAPGCASQLLTGCSSSP